MKRRSSRRVSVPVFKRLAGNYQEDGQVSILVVLAVATFLMIFVGFGVDMTSLFFHRQTAQNAADSACVAGVMDMQRERVNGTCHTAGGTAYPCGNFTVGTAFNCSTTPNAAPCKYASLNGYSGTSAGIPASGVESNSVQVTFPAAIPGVITPDASITGPYPFLQVDVYDGVRLYFSSWLSGASTQVVHALAKCGLQTAQQPVPILVLDPSDAKSFQVNGNPSVQILGGPNRSIQVNSDASSANESGDAAYLSGYNNGNKTQVDLTQAGLNYDGADFGVTGGSTSAPASFKTNSPFAWRSGANPLADPFIVLPPPPDLGTPGTGTPVLYGVNGCPDKTLTPPGGTGPGCIEYTPGVYKSGINVSNYTAIFDPGVYYIEGGALEFHANSLVRPSTLLGADNSRGTIFYLTCSKPGSCTSGSVANVNIGANAGGNAADAFDTSRAHCPNDTPWDARAGIPASVGGNVLLAPCTTLGTYVGAVMPNVGTDAVGPLRGVLFFADRSASTAETMNGGGGLLLTGTLYFRDCPSLLTTGTCNQPPTDYQTTVSLTGGSGSGTRVYGEIVTDQLSLNGNSGITMDLNPWSRPILKVELLQ